MATKPAFREAYKKRRCLVLADGFYEWQKVAGGKQPVYIRLREGSQFAFGGLRERWHDAERRVDSFTIITVEPNELCAKIHDRMPLILPEADFAAWLDSNASGEQLTALLKPYRAAEMESFPVSKLVNSPGNDSAECVKPIETLTRRAPAEERDLFSWNRSWLDCIRHVTKPSEAVGVAPSRTPQGPGLRTEDFPLCADAPCSR